MTSRDMTLLSSLMDFALRVVGQFYATIPRVGGIAGRFGVAPADAALVGSTPSFELLLAARALQGSAPATFPPAALSPAKGSLPPQQRPFGVSPMSFAFLGAPPLALLFPMQSGRGPARAS